MEEEASSSPINSLQYMPASCCQLTLVREDMDECCIIPAGTQWQPRVINKQLRFLDERRKCIICKQKADGERARIAGTHSFSSFSLPHISFLLLASAMAVSTHVQCRYPALCARFRRPAAASAAGGITVVDVGKEVLEFVQHLTLPKETLSLDNVYENNEAFVA